MPHAAPRGHGVPCLYEIEAVVAFYKILAKIFSGNSETKQNKI